MLEFKGVTKQYLYGARVLCALDMKIESGEVVSILGDEGSGKTTFIKVASKATDFDGEILLDGEKIETKNDDTIVVFDDLAMFEQRTTYYNLAYPLKMRGFDKFEIDKRIKAACERLGILSILYERVKPLSLIDKKRIALTRLFIRDAKVIYVDDITSGLDYLDRKVLFDEFSSIVEEKSKAGVTIIYSTSNLEEAMALSNRIVVMHYGEIKQIGTFDEIYSTPSNIWALEAVDENYNFEKVKIDGDKLVFGDYKLDISSLDGKYLKEYDQKEVYCAWHSEDFDFSSQREEKVDKAIRIKEGYILQANDKKVLSKERLETVSTLPKGDKVMLFDFYSESSIMKR